MTVGLSLLQKLFAHRLARGARENLAAMTNDQRKRYREHASDLLQRLAQDPQPVLIGETDWGQAVRIPLALIVSSWSMITGGTGAGKSMLAAGIIEALLAAPEQEVSFGLLDPKPELFGRALYLVHRLLQTLPPLLAERLRERLVIIDFASTDPITPFNLTAPWSGTDLDFFASARMEALTELFPGADAISLRGGSILKHIIKLLAEQQVPFGFFDQVLSSESFRARLVAGSNDEELRYYFQHHFPSEPRATVAALRARLQATLFSSASLKLALSGPTAPDFRALMDSGAVILVNTAGPNISRATARTLQSVVVSDIRSAVFARERRNDFLWIFEEAQNFFKTRQLRENVIDLLTTSRSFAMHGLLITQNMSTAVQDSDILETLYTNVRLATVLRGTPKDAGFIQQALPATGRRTKPRMNPYIPIEFYSLSEERNLLLQEISSLKDREAWFWIKSLTSEAFRMRTRTVDIPCGLQLKDAIEPLHSDAALGRRISRKAYVDDIARRRASWFTDRSEHPQRDIVAELTDLYRSDEQSTA